MKQRSIPPFAYISLLIRTLAVIAVLFFAVISNILSALMYHVLLLTTYGRAITLAGELTEAATIDGADVMTKLTRITQPLLKGVIRTTTYIVFTRTQR